MTTDTQTTTTAGHRTAMAARGDLDGKVAIVTGGNSGIGEASVHRLARAGAGVAILARRTAEGESVARAVAEAGGDALFVSCDVMERDAIEAAVAQVVERYGGVHILFNNAGGAQPHGLTEPGDDAWEWTLRLNLTSAYVMTQVCWPHLTAAGGASVVNMSSGAAAAAVSEPLQRLVPGLPPPAYWAAKAGMEAFTRYLATMGAPHGIRANALRPGQIITPLTTRTTPGRHGAEALFAQVQLTEGPGYPEDVANLVYFLASDESRFINGQVIDIDGGAVLKV
jgi:7-alpha-hydroxysteroid dehydrogenase